MKKSTLFLISLFSSSLLWANSTHHHHHSSHNQQPTTEFGQAYLDSMEGMHQGMEQAAFAKDPDVSFAEGMIYHHQGAIEMAKIQLKYGKDPEMRKLAEEIIKAQDPEIEQMENWLKQHNK